MTIRQGTINHYSKTANQRRADGGILPYAHGRGAAGAETVRAARKRISADDRERLEWYGMDRDYDPEYLDLDECREIVEAINS